MRPGAARAGPRLPGADRRRRDQPRLRPARALPERQGGRHAVRARRLLLQGRVRGPRRDGPARRRARRARRSSRRCAPTRSALRDKGPEPEELPTDDDTRPLGGAHRQPGARRRRSGACARSRSTWTSSTTTSTRTCCSSSTGAARGVKGEAVARAAARTTSSRASSACGASRTTCSPRALLGYFPCYTEGNDIVVLDPDDRETRADALHVPAPARARPHLPRRLLPPEGLGRARRRRGHGASRRAHEVTELMARLEADGEFAEQLFVHGLGVQTAEGLAEWLHCEGPRGPRHRAHAGPALLVGLPGGAGPVRAPQGREAARPRPDRDERSPPASRPSPSSRRSRSSPTTPTPSTSA